jgi:hypothetical protein
MEVKAQATGKAARSPLWWRGLSPLARTDLDQLITGAFQSNVLPPESERFGESAAFTFSVIAHTNSKMFALD